MKLTREHGIWLLALAMIFVSIGVASAQDKPNILFIMPDDIGIFNIAAYHRGLMVGETPNIDRLA
ncbi:MAG: arylsulfatase, partial [Acidobacteriota bacterium]